jgi:NAD(P)H-hydrate repair Nnr-like enzyme with NAD(P)H-hydrate dehydratase domain
MGSRLAAAAAAFVHGRAGQLVRHERGAIASDVVATLPQALA